MIFFIIFFLPYFQNIIIGMKFYYSNKLEQNKKITIPSVHTINIQYPINSKSSQIRNGLHNFKIKRVLNNIPSTIYSTYLIHSNNRTDFRIFTFYCFKISLDHCEVRVRFYLQLNVSRIKLVALLGIESQISMDWSQNISIVSTCIIIILGSI